MKDTEIDTMWWSRSIMIHTIGKPVSHTLQP